MVAFETFSGQAAVTNAFLKAGHPAIGYDNDYDEATIRPGIHISIRVKMCSTLVHAYRVMVLNVRVGCIPCHDLVTPAQEDIRGVHTSVA